MISALSGSSSAANLVSLFARQQSQTSSTTTTPTRTAQSPLANPLPISGGQGFSAQALISSLLQALNGGGSNTAATSASESESGGDGSGTAGAQAGSASNDLSALLSKLMNAMDTNGDGTVSQAEITAAAGTLAQSLESGGPGGPHPRQDKDGDGATTSAAGTATETGTATGTAAGTPSRSLYQSVFEAMTAADGTANTASPGNDLARQVLASLQYAA